MTLAGDRPTQTLGEVWTEARLTKTKVVVVEGPADSRFFRSWLKKKIAERPGKAPLVLSTKEIDIPDDEVFALGLPDGDRSRVMVAARSASAIGADARCIADLDCGHYCDRSDSSVQLWTDFPAVESYAFKESTLDVLNLTFLDEKLPNGQQLINDLTEPLALLYEIRVPTPDMESPNVEAGFAVRGDVGSFELSRTVAPHLTSQANSISANYGADPRSVVYGHDLAAMLMALFANILKNQLQVRTAESLERHIHGAILIEGSFELEPLFQELAEWLS